MELAYTGLSTSDVKELLILLAELKGLTYLGLRGNRIGQSVVKKFILASL